MELIFVPQQGDGSAKRRRPKKSCESCRMRKKRCVHVSVEDEDHCAAENAQNNRDKDHSEGANRRPVLGKRRFVSDLKPEATFVPRHRPCREINAPQNENIGVWVDKREWDALVRQKTDRAATASVHDSNNTRDKPHAGAVEPLIDIYFSKIHPILPLLDEADFRQEYADGTVPEPLTHAMCLVAAKDSDAESHLHLVGSTVPILAREFCSRLHATITTAIRHPNKYEKIALIRILALMSLHDEGPDGAEEASLHITQAMHYTQTMGWHLGQHTGLGSEDNLMPKRIFWCLWSLDRVNSCIHGRPVMMSDIDIAIEPFEPGESSFPAFEVWLYLCRLLNQIISYYRPGTPSTVTGWEDGFPSFEDAVEFCKGWTLPRHTLATLHLFYLLLAVLSHRSRSVKSAPRASASYVRQSLCAIEIVRVLGSYLLSTLHPLPILPYAISLSLSVSYQHLRQSRLHHQQEDARDEFRQASEIIQKIRRVWSSADTIAAISKTVCKRLENATDLSTFSIGHDARISSPGPCTASMDKPHTLIDQRTSTELEVASATRANDSAVAIDNLSSTTITGADQFGNLFDGVDDIFGTYLDLNNPLNLDDFPFMDNIGPVDWTALPP
jgi:hypothetical protein